MAFKDVYIAKYEKEFDWDGDDDWNEGTPPRMSPFFPPSAPVELIKQKIERGEWKGRQSDWEAWVAPVHKSDIEALLIEWYGEYEERYRDMPHLLEKYRAIRGFVAGLSQGDTYLLVATIL